MTKDILNFESNGLINSLKMTPLISLVPLASTFYLIVADELLPAFKVEEEDIPVEPPLSLARFPQLLDFQALIGMYVRF